MNKTHRTKALYIITILLLNIIAIYCYLFLETKTNKEQSELILNANKVGTEIKQRLTSELNNTKYVVDSIATSLNKDIQTSLSLPNDSNQLKSILKSILKKRSHLNGAYIAFEDARSLGCKKKLYSLYLRREDSSFVSIHIDNQYDYTKNPIIAPWFYQTKKNNHATWISPFYGSVGNKRITSYAVPIHLSDSSICVFGVNYTSMDLYFLLNNWKTPRVGYPYLMNREGLFIAHPDNETRSLKQLALQYKESTLISIADCIQKGDTEFPNTYYHKNTVSKAMCWEKIFYIKDFDWFLGLSVTNQQVYSNPSYFNRQRQHYIRFSFTFFIIFLLIELLFIRKLTESNQEFLRISSFVLFLFLCIELLFIYHYCLKYPIVEFTDNELHNTATAKQKLLDNKTISTQKRLALSEEYDRWNFAMILDSDGICKNMKLYSDDFKFKNKFHPTTIPTGLYVQTIQFSDSYSALITGYIWQTYKINDRIRRGVLFPDAESTQIEREDSSYIFTPNGEKVLFYRWHFMIKIREPFYYRLYPFDRNELWIRLWHVDYDKNIILVPDLNSYRLLHPSFNPGLDNDIIIPGWGIEGSYFSFKEKNYNTNFGKDQYFTKSAFPELHYNVMLKRSYLDPIITRIIPLLVLLLMAFAILHIARKEDALDVAIACSGLLFIAVFEQVNLRHNLNTEGIIYLEYYYFITYILLILVAVNTLTNNLLQNLFPKKDVKFDTLKIIYWPIMLLLILIATIFTFY
jgi:hypothetical protein